MKELVSDEFAIRELLLGLLLGAAAMGVVVALALVVVRRAVRTPVTGASVERPPVAAAPSPPTAATAWPGATTDARGRGRLMGSPSTPSPTQPPGQRMPWRAGHGDDGSAERAVVVDGLADLALRLPPGLDREAIDILARVGVGRRSANGMRFDPRWQDALGSDVTDDPTLDGVVVRTVRDFFDDRGRPASRPQVVVATLRSDTGPGTPGDAAAGTRGAES